MELLPLWLAPNMVTLIGFFFILGNVLLLEIFMPDMVGPVRQLAYTYLRGKEDCGLQEILKPGIRARVGYTIASLSGYGCE